MPTQDMIRDLKPGKQVRDAVYLLAEKQVRTAKNGSLFLSARLRDATSEIEARFWDLPLGVAEALEAGQGVRVSGEVTSFQGRAQLRLDRIEPQPIRAQDFFPTSSQPLPAMQARLEEYVRSITEPWLHRLLEKVLLDPAFLPRFVQAPAAREYHHACLGGLIEHTLGVAGLAEVAARLYPGLSRDLLLALALLHDCGKVEAYEWDADFRRSDEGRLLDHIYLGTRRVEMAIAEWPDFPVELRRRILHAMLAHHGDSASGSPVRPQTQEAIALHLLDMLDAHIRGFEDHVERHALPGTAWTEWSRMFGAQLYRGPEEPAAGGTGSPKKTGQPWDELEEEGEGDLPF
jgi:3'-5' exoribonuclease